MAFPIIPRVRSGASGYPTSLYVGELAVNTKDGELYLGADNGVVKLAVPGAAGTTATQFTGTGSATDFAPIQGWTSTSAAAYLVSVGGIDQRAGVDYTIGSANGGTLQLATAPANGVPIQVRAITQGTGGGGSGNATQLQGVDVSGTAPTNGQVLAYNGTAWTPTTATGGAAGYGRTRFIGNGTQTQFTPIQGFNVANINRNNYLITINNVLQDTDVDSPTFSFSTDNDGTLTFTSAPSNNARIVVRALGGYGNLEVPRQGPALPWYGDAVGGAINLIGNVSQNTSNVPFAGAAAADFSGAGATLSALQFASSVNMSADFTIECWSNSLTSAVGSPSLIAWGAANSGSETGIAYYGNQEFQSWASSLHSALGSGSDTLWHHLALCFDSQAGTLTGYYDGALAFTETSVSCSGIYSMNIGCHPSINSCQFFGLVSNFRISNVIRYTSAFTPQTSNFTADGNTVSLLTMNN